MITLNDSLNHGRLIDLYRRSVTDNLLETSLDQQTVRIIWSNLGLFRSMISVKNRIIMYGGAISQSCCRMLCETVILDSLRLKVSSRPI